MANQEQRIVDPDTGEHEMEPGELGELLVKGPHVMKGYWKAPQETSQTVRDGWLYTGDIARIDADGYVYIVDRKKEMIKYKGFSVAPAEVEAVLFQHEAVANCAVIGKPDAESGEIPKALVMLRPGSQAEPEALMEFVGARLAGYKRVREVEFVLSIPTTASGKVLRRVLIEAEREKVEAQVAAEAETAAAAAAEAAAEAAEAAAEAASEMASDETPADETPADETPASEAPEASPGTPLPDIAAEASPESAAEAVEPAEPSEPEVSEPEASAAEPPEPEAPEVIAPTAEEPESPAEDVDEAPEAMPDEAPVAAAAVMQPEAAETGEDGPVDATDADADAEPPARLTDASPEAAASDSAAS